jgi:hypothetical protein
MDSRPLDFSGRTTACRYFVRPRRRRDGACGRAGVQSGGFGRCRWPRFSVRHWRARHGSPLARRSPLHGTCVGASSCRSPGADAVRGVCGRCRSRAAIRRGTSRAAAGCQATHSSHHTPVRVPRRELFGVCRGRQHPLFCPRGPGCAVRPSGICASACGGHILGLAPLAASRSPGAE